MSNRNDVNRSNLPIPDIQHPGLITYDAKDPDTKFPPIRDVRPPKGSPNVLVILIDDVGYGATSVFGGPCQTPNFEKLAKGGLSTRASTRRRCARRPGRRCSPGATITRSAWAASPRLRRPRPATARCCPTPRRRWRSPSSSMATRRRSSANATRSRCGRPVRPDRSTRGRPAVAGSSTSTASSAARTTSGTRPCMRARRRSSRPRRPPRATT